MAQVVIGNRGGKILIHGGYRYQRNQSRENAIYWRCWRDGCLGRLRTNVFDVNNLNAAIQVLYANNNHDHGMDTAEVDRGNLTEDMKTVIRNDPSKRIRNVYDEVVQQAVIQGIGNIPSYDSVRSILNRTRLENIPPLPNNVNQVVLNGVWIITWTNDLYLQHKDNNNGILLFGTDDDLRILDGADCVFLDGTFRSAPRPYMQFFTIHGHVNDYTLKLACALLTNKQA